MNWRAVTLGIGLLGLGIALAGCAKKQPPAEPPVTPTSTSIVPPAVPGSYTQIAFQRDQVAITPLASFLANAQSDARRYWRSDASLRQVDVAYDQTADVLGYQLRFISLRGYVSGNPSTLMVYYNYETPIIEAGTLKHHEPDLTLSGKLVALNCERDDLCNTVNYSGRAPIPIPAINYNFLESYALVADKIRELNQQAGSPPYAYSLQVEANQPQWIFYQWRVNATTGAVTSLNV